MIVIYNVLDIFPIGNNTSVTIKGNGNGLKNNVMVTDENEKNYKLLSVAFVSGQSEINKTTTILIEGKFNSKLIKL